MKQKVYNDLDEVIGYMDDEENIYLLEESGIFRIPAEFVIEGGDEPTVEEDGEPY